MRKFISQGTQKHTRARSDSQISQNKSRNKSLFNQLGHHVNAASRKSLEIQG